MSGVARRLLIISNRAAGRVRSGQLRTILGELRRLGCETVVRQVDTAAGSIEHLARTAEPGFDVIVAAGGDGTVNAVANGVAAAGRPIAVLPLGTVNLLAREIGMPRDPADIARVVATAPIVAMRPGRVGDRLFLVVASAGVDAATVAAVDPGLKRRIGRFAFLLPALRQLLTYPRNSLSVCVNGAKHDAALVIASRLRLYGGPFVVAPEASLADPELHLTLLPRGDSGSMLRYLGELARNRLPRDPAILHLRCREATVEAGWPLPVQADGEIFGHLPATLGIADFPLMLIRPFEGHPPAEAVSNLQQG